MYASKMELGIMEWLDIRTILVFVAISSLLVWLIRATRGPANLPPGPINWPILGSVPQLLLEYYQSGRPGPHELLGNIARKYGKLYTISLGGLRVMVANDYDTVKEASRNHLTAARPAQFKDTIGGEGIALCSGEPWIQQRRFTLSTMRSFGVGKMSFEEQIVEETDYLVKEFKKYQGKPFDPQFFILNAASNIVCSVLFGKRYEYSDTEFHYLLDILDKLTKKAGSGGAMLYIPILKYFVSDASDKLAEDLLTFLKGIINKHRSVYDHQNLKDYIDVYLREMELSREVTSYLNEPNMLATLAHIFFAGTDTSGTTIRWALMFMMENPDVQKKVHDEIDAVVGRDRLPKLTDRPNLPYTDAVIHEVFRHGVALPLSVPHCATEDTTTKGYHIPKGTAIVLNLWAAHNDPDMWDEPRSFNPERFLDEHGGLQKTDKIIPFSLGRRQCPGEHLARKEVFILYTHLMHQFDFKKANDTPLNFKGMFGVTVSPVPFEVCAHLRE